MRPIKFRAWDKINKCMVCSHSLTWIGFDGSIWTEAGRKFDTPNMEIETDGTLEIMQFTGLHDKNGIEIYESDKVKFHDELTGKYFVGVVEFKDGSFCIVTEFITHYRLIDYDMEVIGNIY